MVLYNIEDEEEWNEVEAVYNELVAAQTRNKIQAINPVRTIRTGFIVFTADVLEYRIRFHDDFNILICGPRGL